MNRAAASKYLLDKHGISRTPGTLAKYACTGGGPRFRLLGRLPDYQPEHLDEYAAEITSPLVRSTSELPPRPKRRERSAAEPANVGVA